MTVRGKTWLGLAALLLALPGTAKAADGLECMAQSYGPEKLAEISALSTRFSFDDTPQSTGNELSQIGIKAAYDCYEENAWSERTLYYATIFELGRLSEAAYRQSGHLTAEQIRTFDQALSGRDRPELWALMERAVIAGLEGREPESTPQEEVLMGGFLISAGLGSDDTLSTRIGELMGTMALQRIGRREFAALAQGE